MAGATVICWPPGRAVDGGADVGPLVAPGALEVVGALEVAGALDDGGRTTVDPPPPQSTSRATSNGRAH